MNNKRKMLLETKKILSTIALTSTMLLAGCKNVENLSNEEQKAEIEALLLFNEGNVIVVFDTQESNVIYNRNDEKYITIKNNDGSFYEFNDVPYVKVIGQTKEEVLAQAEKFLSNDGEIVYLFDKEITR